MKMTVEDEVDGQFESFIPEEIKGSVVGAVGLVVPEKKYEKN